MKSRKQPERVVQTQIIHWLQIRQRQGVNCMFWRQPTMGAYYAKERKFLAPMGAGTRKGIADILGIWEGQPLAIEVKSKYGRLTKEQKEFLEEWSARGGISIVARCVDDVEKALANVV